MVMECTYDRVLQVKRKEVNLEDIFNYSSQVKDNINWKMKKFHVRDNLYILVGAVIIDSGVFTSVKGDILITFVHSVIPPTPMITRNIRV